jgi:hypothetical protein
VSWYIGIFKIPIFIYCLILPIVATFDMYLSDKLKCNPPLKVK